MPGVITDEQWQSIDESIFACQKLEAIKLIRAASGASLSEGVELLYKRYYKLLAEQRDRFTVGPDGLWA